MAYDVEITPGPPPLLWSNVKEAFDQINQNFEILAATIGDGSGLSLLDFGNLNSDVIPAENGTFDLGSATKRWKNLWLASTGFSVGDAAIQTTEGGDAIALPSGSTVGGILIRNPEESSFKTIAVAGQSNVVADNFSSTLTLSEGLGIEITTNPATDTVAIKNTGVVELNGTAGQIGVSEVSEGEFTLTNLGVLSTTAGLGIAVSTASGVSTVSNSGIVEIESGDTNSLTVSARNPTTGRVTITNTAPAGNAFRSIVVTGETTLTASSPAAQLQFVEGSGIDILTTPANPGLGLLNRISISNTGVRSITTGRGLSVSAASGDIQIELTNESDIIGSVFAEDSTLFIDGATKAVYANDISISGILEVSQIDTSDSSEINIIPAAVFNSDVTIENELFIGTSRVISLDELKFLVASSTDFTDFQTRISTLN